ncbi:MAG: acetolactate decarboxylase [bacterium]
MKSRLILPLVAWVLTTPVVDIAAPSDAASRDLIYQISTYDSLSKGGYAGIVPLQDLAENGDFGIGTFENIDGEMVMVDGVIYQVTVDGAVHAKKGPDLAREWTPYAVVTRFEPDLEEALKAIDDYAGLQRAIDAKLTQLEEFYAIRVDGVFEHVKTRSVPAQTRPYPVLTEVIKQQASFELRNVRGTLVGFWCPAYVGGVNVAGYHLHFVTSDRTAGGHVLELKLKEGVLKLDRSAELYMKVGGRAGDQMR